MNKEICFMNTYEIVATYYNGCAGEAFPVRTILEAEAASPEDFLREKHPLDWEKFVKEPRPNGNVLYVLDTGFLKYTYEFTLV